MKTKLLYLLLGLFASSIAKTQDNCLMIPDKNATASGVYGRISGPINTWNTYEPCKAATINIAIHHIRRDNNTGGSIYNNFEAELIDRLNTIFEGTLSTNNTFIKFNLANTFYEADSKLYDGYHNIYDVRDKTTLGVNGKFTDISPNAQTNVIDIYFFNNDYSSSSGIAPFGGTSCIIFGKSGLYAPDAEVVAHELGHCLGLYHTFYGTACNNKHDNYQGYPEAFGSDESGDYVADTNPDPTIWGVNAGTCTSSYIAMDCDDKYDISGVLYNPLTDNVMDYYESRACMQNFTEQQGIRMRTALANRGLLKGVVIQELETVTVATSLSSVCSGASVTLEIDHTSNPNYYFKWDKGSEGIELDATSITVHPTANNHTYILNAHSRCINDEKNITTIITVDENFVLPEIGGSSSICLGSKPTFTNAIAGGSWSSSNTFVASINATSGLIETFNAGTTIITYTKNSPTLGCPVSVSKTVYVVSPTAVVSILASKSTICLGESTTLTVSPLGMSCDWYSDNDRSNSVGYGNPITFTPTTSGSVIYYLTANSPCNVEYEIKSGDITVNPLPIMQPITGLATEMCAGNSYPIDYGPKTGGNGEFTLTSGSTLLAGTVNTTPPDPPYLPLFEPSNYGSGTLTYTFTNTATNCVNATSTPVVVLPSTPVITGSTELCPGNIYHFTANADGGTWASSNTNIVTVDADGNVLAIDAGTTTITYEVSLCGVVKTASYTITVLLVPKIIGKSYMCLGTNQTLSLNTTTPFQTVLGFSPNWTSNNVSIASFPNPPTGAYNSICELQANSVGKVIVKYQYSDQSNVKCISGGGFLTMEIYIDDCNNTNCDVATTCTTNIDNPAGTGIIQYGTYEDGLFCVQKDLEITGSVIMKNSTINIATDRKITVADGAVLTIQGCHLYSCTNMWEGIEVKDGGKLFIDGINDIIGQPIKSSFIEDAKIAIAYNCSNPLVGYNGGQLLRINNTIFNRNKIGVQIENFKNNATNDLTDLPFKVGNCLFTCRQIQFSTTSLFWPKLTDIIETKLSATTNYPHTALSYIHPYIDDYSPSGAILYPDNVPSAYLKNGGADKPVAGIVINNVGNSNANGDLSQITIGAIGSVQNPNTLIFDNVDIGIDVLKSNVVVNNCTFQKPNPDSETPNQNAIGINAVNSSLNSITINTPTSQYANNAFFSMNTAINIDGGNYIKANNCDIRSVQDVANATSGSSLLGYNGIRIVDIYYNGIEALNNRIYNIRNAIWFSGDGEIADINFTLFGNFDVNNNTIGTSLPNIEPELLLNGAFVDRAITLENVIGGLVNEVPVNCNANIITNVYNGIKLSNWNEKTTIVNDNTIDLAFDNAINPNDKHYGISLEIGLPNAAAMNVVQNNTVNGSSENLISGGYDASKQTAILLNKQLKTNIGCNRVTRCQHGFRFVNVNSGTRWWNNEMNFDNQNGMTLDDNGVIDRQGFLPRRGTACTSDNVWIGWTGVGSWGGYTTNCINGSNPINSKLIVKQSGIGTNPDGGGVNDNIGFPAYQSGNGTIIYSYNMGVCERCGSAEEELVRLGDIAIENLEAIADGSFSIETLDSAQRLYTMQQHLYELMMANPELENRSTVLNNFIQTNQWSSFDFIYYTNYFLARGDMNTVELLLGFWPTSSNDLDNNYYTYFDWMATMNNIPNWQPDSLQVLDLASKCPATNGNVVYAARNLYNRLTKKINNFTNNCSSNGFNRKAPAPIVDNTDLLIYPNPARNAINIKWKTIAQVDVYDYTGRALITKNFDNASNATIDVSKLAKGFYIVKLTTKIGETKSSKLIIE